MKKLLASVAFATMTSPLFAALPDAAGAVGTATTLFEAVGVLALGILAWAIGSRLARKYIK